MMWLFRWGLRVRALKIANFCFPGKRGWPPDKVEEVGTLPDHSSVGSLVSEKQTCSGKLQNDLGFREVQRVWGRTRVGHMEKRTERYGFSCGPQFNSLILKKKLERSKLCVCVCVCVLVQGNCHYRKSPCLGTLGPWGLGVPWYVECSLLCTPHYNFVSC
jgi:hypothetical protein